MVLHTDYYHTQLSVLGVGSTVGAMSAGGAVSAPPNDDGAT